MEFRTFVTEMMRMPVQIIRQGRRIVFLVLGSGTYRLGVTPTLGPYLLPHILPAIHRRYSAVKLYVREDVPRNLEAGLVARDHDLILTALPVDEDRITVVPFLHEPLKLVMSAEHRLAKKRRIDRRDLAGESILTIEEHHHYHRQIQDLSDRLGAHVLRDYGGTSLDTLRQMVVMGMGIAFLPALYVRSEIHRPRELRVTSVHGEDIPSNGGVRLARIISCSPSLRANRE